MPDAASEYDRWFATVVRTPIVYYLRREIARLEKRNQELADLVNFYEAGEYPEPVTLRYMHERDEAHDLLSVAHTLFNRGGHDKDRIEAWQDRFVRLTGRYDPPHDE